MLGIFENRTAHSLQVRIFLIFSLMPVVGLTTFAHATEICIEHPYYSAATEDKNSLLALYQGIAPVLDRFPSLAAALDNAAPDLCFTNVMDGALGYLDVNENRIVIRENLSKGLQNGVFLHELRHLEQFARGFCPSDELAMTEYARASFAVEADASAISLLVAWNMKENGNASVWTALSSWPPQSDIAASFANEMDKTGDIALAVTAAFNQWYSSNSRLELYYLATCSDYLDRQDATHNLPLYQLVPDAFLEDLCKLPDSSSYECSQPEIKLH